MFNSKLGLRNCFVFQGNTGNFAKLIKNELKYLGPVDLTQYFVKNFTIHDEDDLLKTSTNGNKGVQIDFIFSRRLLNQVLTVFMPTIAIVIVSFCTTFFKVRQLCEHFKDSRPNFYFIPAAIRL